MDKTEYTLLDLLQAEATLTRASNIVELIKRVLKQKEEATRVTPTEDEIQKKFDEILGEIKRSMVGSRLANLDQHHGSITFDVTNDFEPSRPIGSKWKPPVPSKKNIALAKAVQKKLIQAKFTVTSRVEVYMGDHADPNGAEIVFKVSW